MWTFFGAAVGLLCFFSSATWGAPPAEGSKAPLLTLREFRDDSQVVTSQVLRDHVTLLSFFATWCAACKQEVRELKKLQDRYRSRGFQVILVCLDIMGARNVGPYLEEAGGADLHVATDKGGVTANRYGVVRLPTNVLVGADEAVVLSWDTFRPEKVAQVDSFLSRLPSVPAPASDKP